MSFWNFLGRFALFNLVCDLFSGDKSSRQASNDLHSRLLVDEEMLEDYMVYKCMFDNHDEPDNYYENNTIYDADLDDFDDDDW